MAVKTGTTLIECKKLVTIRFINDILGSAPANKKFYEKYLLSKLNKEIDKTKRKMEKAKDEQEREILLEKLDDLEAQLAELPDVEDREDEKLTVFYRAKYNTFDVPVIRAHQVLGFFKEAANNFKDILGIRNARDKVSRYVRVMPYNLFIYDTEILPECLVDDVDDIEERPLKAMTAQGPRVSIAKSEVIRSKGDKLIQFEVWLYRNKEITWEVLQTLMEYGRVNGISQWRNSGYYGAFEVVSVEDVE